MLPIVPGCFLGFRFIGITDRRMLLRDLKPHIMKYYLTILLT